MELSRKKRDEIKKVKEENDKILYNRFTEGLDDLYFDLYGDEYDNFFQYFMDLLEKRYFIIERDKGVYDNFKKFIDRNSTHREEFKDKKINDYLEDVSSEEEEDEEKYEFLMKKTERF